MYDYVIVGGGSAGCVLAARLSENPDSRVLLLEAGPEASADEIEIPAAMRRLLQSKYDWNYTTVPQDGRPGRSTGRGAGSSAARRRWTP